MKLSLEFLANTAEAADSSPGLPAILRQCFTNLLFRNLGAFQESSSATSPTDQGRFAVIRPECELAPIPPSEAKLPRRKRWKDVDI
jgi:hypothetical protein